VHWKLTILNLRWLDLFWSLESSQEGAWTERLLRLLKEKHAHEYVNSEKVTCPCGRLWLQKLLNRLTYLKTSKMVTSYFLNVRTFSKILLQIWYTHKINPSEPCVPYIGRAYHYPPDVALYMYIYIFFIYISTEYFKHATHSPFFSSKCRLFHNATFFGFCIIHILHTECAKI
jgi:hypothetical protein